MKLSPKSEALAYRIWAYCEPRGWNVTVKDLGADLGVSWQRARTVCRHKGWLSRLRVESVGVTVRGSGMDTTVERLDLTGDDWHSFREHLSDLAIHNA